ncbi:MULTISPECIES: DUF3108 domain-containing protein [unclassified Rhizobium]|uniref:DUF3108 domain-containing protein n=2 Tax=Rhizobium TaxID=379 RepID=UPI000713BAC6|nr:hypothetical protein ASG50_18945 [Rhizobium sp. Leaf386]KQT03271.1 hypothetical protein ASG42_25040 [Rhizobium sp. Leaf391]KQU08320.1 hypothetical protein ASG68_22245 [Rhizobium sp. Leaf453]
MNLRIGVSALLAFAMATFSTGVAGAVEVTHNTDYSIALAGLPIAKASFHTELKANRYTISGTMNSAGLADLFAETSGQTSVSGTVGRDRLSASEYKVRYKTGKRGRAIDVQFRNGDVTSASMKPARKIPKNWIPVTKADMRNVVDPLSGLIFPADTRVCPKSVPVFDGESRMDLKLSAKGTKPFKTEGFQGDVIVCGIKFVPKSGYRKGRDDVDYLRKLETMEIWFAKAESVNVYAPVYVRIPTSYGAVTIWATRFGS